MNIEIDESFKKDFLKILDKNIKKRIIYKLDYLKDLENIYEWNNIKTIKWFHNFYRMRIWDYRIWMKIEEKKLVILRVRHRKDIYKIFP